MFPLGSNVNIVPLQNSGCLSFTGVVVARCERLCCGDDPNPPPPVPTSIMYTVRFLKRCNDCCCMVEEEFCPNELIPC